MATTLDRDLETLRARAQDDEALAETLALLADDPFDTGDPFARPSEGLLAAARQVSDRRAAATHGELRGRSLTTRQVSELIVDLSGRGAVAARRARKRLLGITDGRDTLHPSWQFSFDRRETHDGLTEVLAALGEHTSDPASVDALATTPQPDAGGRSIADLLAAGQVADAVAAARAAGDQS